MTLSMLLTILILIVLLAFGGGLLALIVYGLGWLLHLITKFDLFQSTLLGLASMFAFGYLADRVFSAIFTLSNSSLEDQDLDEDFEDEFDEDFEDEFEEQNARNPYPGIPRWRQPLKQVDFSKARPNDLCPCGSGRKFKHCHGAKRTT